MNGRVALVTGGGRGIGREAALLLSAAGARVMIASRSETELAALGLEYVVADLGTTEGCGLAVAETERRLGPIDLLVVNHGVGSACKPASTTDQRPASSVDHAKKKTSSRFSSRNVSGTLVSLRRRSGQDHGQTSTPVHTRSSRN